MKNLVFALIIILLTSCSPLVKYKVTKRIVLTDRSYIVCGKKNFDSKIECIHLKSWKRFDATRSGYILINPKKIKR